MSAKKVSLRDIGRALDEQRRRMDRAEGEEIDRTAGQVDRDRLSDALFPSVPVVWSERGWDGMMERMTELKAKLDAQASDGEEPSLTAQEQEDLDQIVQSVMEAVKPLMAAFRDLVEHFVEWMGDFVNSTAWTELANLSMSVGERESQVETIEVVDTDGNVVAVHPITPVPAAAQDHVSLNVASPLVQPVLDHRSPTDMAIERSLARPFTDPLHIGLLGGR